MIGSIEEVNRKISKLDRKLQQYTQLVVESRASQQEEDESLFIRPPSDIGREIIERKGLANNSLWTSEIVFYVVFLLTKNKKMISIHVYEYWSVVEEIRKGMFSYIGR